MFIICDPVYSVSPVYCKSLGIYLFFTVFHLSFMVRSQKTPPYSYQKNEQGDILCSFSRFQITGIFQNLKADEKVHRSWHSERILISIIETWPNHLYSIESPIPVINHFCHPEWQNIIYQFGLNFCLSVFSLFADIILYLFFNCSLFFFA